MKTILLVLLPAFVLVGCANGPWQRHDQYRVVTNDGHVVTTPARGKWEVNREPAGLGLTPETYMHGRSVHPSCQTGNWGADGNCLLRLVPALVEKQKQCNAGMNVANCGKNPGKIAGEWSRLARELLTLQQKAEAGIPQIESQKK